MKTKLALFVMKVMRYLLLKIGRGGSLPGTIALKIDPDFLKKLNYPKHVIVVSSTNGKTTTSNMIFEVLQKHGFHVIGNRKGDNLKMGIVTTLGINCDSHLNVKADAVVLEVDELTLSRVLPEMKVSAVVFNNFFKDQLDRSLSVDNILTRLEKVLYDYEGMMILNANDANVVRLGESALKAEKIYYEVEKHDDSTETGVDANEGIYCPVCSNKLKYEYYQYSHIGKFACPHCSFGHQPIKYSGYDVNVNDGTFKVNGETFTAVTNAVYAIYNCMSVVSLMKELDVDMNVVKETFASFELKDGRNEIVEVNGKSYILNLVKNPTGANETMKYIQSEKVKKDILIILNNNESDGVDISWIWDARFEQLMREDVEHIICSGMRAYDMALRFKYSGYETIEVIESIPEAFHKLSVYDNHAYVLATYTGLYEVMPVIRRKA